MFTYIKQRDPQHIGCEKDSDVHTDLMHFCGNIKLRFLGKRLKQTLLKPYRVTAPTRRPMLLYGSECWILTKERMEMAEMTVLTPAAGYGRAHHKTNEIIKE